MMMKFSRIWPELIQATMNTCTKDQDFVIRIHFLKVSQMVLNGMWSPVECRISTIYLGILKVSQMHDTRRVESQKIVP